MPEGHGHANRCNRYQPEHSTDAKATDAFGRGIGFQPVVLGTQAGANATYLRPDAKSLGLGDTDPTPHDPSTGHTPSQSGDNRSPGSFPFRRSQKAE